MSRERTLQPTATLLTFGGLIPFFAAPLVLSGAVLLAPALSSMVVIALLVYAAVILTFVGALHWAHALHDVDLGAGNLVWSVCPSLLAWAAATVGVVFIESRYIVGAAIAALIVGFVAQLYVDSTLRAKPWFPQWFWQLRQRVTLAVCASLVASAIALAIR